MLAIVLTLMMKKKMTNITLTNNNMTIIRNVVYSQLKKMKKNINEIVEVDKDLMNKIDINMKNTINKILHDHRFKEINGYDFKQ